MKGYSYQIDKAQHFCFAKVLAEKKTSLRSVRGIAERYRKICGKPLGALPIACSHEALLRR